METHEFFNKFLALISEKVSSGSYSVWFSNLKIVNITDKEIIIQIPLQAHKTILQQQYMDIIDDVTINLLGKSYDYQFFTEDELNANNDVLNVLDIKNDDKDLSLEWNTNLDPSMNFDNFIIGESNRLAFVSAMNVAQSPSTINNPLFIYGRSGIGKTHLMYAIGNYIHEHSDKKVLYTNCNDFRDEYVEISKKEKGKETIEYANNFKNKYRNVDVLLIDDIQLLVGNEGTQQEFFHTFEALYKANKQIIISSDRSPDDLKKIEDRLRSRFTWGLPVDIYPPDFTLRCDIIKQKLEQSSIKNKINKDVIEYIANACPNDVRHIIGTINRLLAYTAMMRPQVINLDFAIEAIKDFVSTNIYQDNTISHIQKVVADFYKITVEDLKSKKRSNNIAWPRHIAMYLCRIETEENLLKIGQEFGGRDHSTVVASCEKIKTELITNATLNDTIKEIKAKL